MSLNWALGLIYIHKYVLLGLSPHTIYIYINDVRDTINFIIEDLQINVLSITNK